MSPRVVRLPLLLPLALLSVASTCEQCQPIPDPRRGNVDRVADAVLVQGDDDHTYLVTTNPELQHLRVLDLTDERFVDSPNRFFPLSIPVGIETRRIAVASDDEDFVFAMDAAQDQVFMVRTPAARRGDPWVAVGDPIPTGNAPADLAVHKQDGLFVLTISLPDAGSVQRIAVTSDGSVEADTVTAVPGAGALDEVVVDIGSDTLLVGDALGSAVHMLRASDGSFDRDVDIGGAQGAIAVGHVDIGDGVAPVALVGRRDADEVWALRLFRPGYRESRTAVLGGAAVGGLPLATYVNDVADGHTVCCRGLSNDSVDRGEATSAFGAVGLSSGAVLYLSLAADGAGQTRLVRLLDDDPLSLAQDDVIPDENGDDGLWIPGDGPSGVEKRPDPPDFDSASDFGDPPFADHVADDEALLLTWERAPPGLKRVSVDTAGGVITASSVDLEARGARVGDRAVFSVAEPSPGCGNRDLSARVLVVDGASITVAVGGGVLALDSDDQLCLSSSGAVRVSVEIDNAFVVTDSAGRFLGRLALTGRDGVVPPEGELSLAGGTMRLTESALGPPNRGSTLVVPLDPHVVAMGLDLAEPVGRLGEGGFGPAGYLVQGIVGRTMRFPDPREEGAVVKARRLVITTGSADASGLNVVFSCDDAETIAGLCDSYR